MYATEQLVYAMRGVRLRITHFDEDEYGRVEPAGSEEISGQAALGRIRAEYFRHRDRDPGTRIPVARWNNAASWWLEFAQNAMKGDPVERVISALSDVGDIPSRVETVAKAKAREASDERSRLEALAADIASRTKTEPGTIAFIDAVAKLVERARSDAQEYDGGESQAEEYAAHMHAGCVSEYWSNRDFTRGRYQAVISSAEDVLKWIRRNTPLLYMRWREINRVCG